MLMRQVMKKQAMKKQATGIAMAVLTAVGLTLFAGQVSACPRHGELSDTEMSAPRFERGPGAGMRHGEPMMRALRQLELSPEKERQIDVLLQATRSEVRDLGREMAEDRKTLRELALADPYDAKQVQELAERQGRNLTYMLARKTETRHQVLALLTPEQRTQLDEMRENRRCRAHAD